MKQRGFSSAALVTLLVIVAGVVGWWVLTRQSNSSTTADTTQNPTSWVEFKNTQFNYTLSYPSNAHVQTNNDYATDISIEPEVYFFVPGDSILLDVDVWIPWSGTTAEQKKALSQGLQLFADAVRELQVTNPNPYSADRKIGPLQETTLGGATAYSFTLTSAFRSFSGEYSLAGGNEQYVYVIAESPQGQKVVLHYLADNADAEKIFQSFKFINSE
ncbi:hypothetical protein A3A39_03725 [Candidatus Kaiserbacteria bacterium RIFCSPLOWO2_01_FULL_54_13]|uniref:PsbP C-terminal domain-containing protein n=1 Tax=Candidatus Kaiserbacteria bacterium RIFCSPLOWO2_01_FULL_54_13 TaxID=1798512 RepID=A0A1F6F323_9BACT|nr:MAG: hypothetical protein A3A39_03725 [Candidatus Kaiserbacteria bacterium RIFCSPLOWO2_01_FULL_54_13]